MQSVIVYIDDADHARAVLAPLVARAGAAPCRWIVVACAPRIVSGAMPMKFPVPTLGSSVTPPL